MQALLRRPGQGYLGNWLWVPKNYVDAEGVKNALSLRFPDPYSEHKVRYVYLYRETENHLLVPRHLWEPGSMPFRVTDCRPREYEHVPFKSRIKLDHRLIDGQLVPTGEDVQQKAMAALLRADSGILQLGCVSGDTIINLNRSGGGKKYTVRDAWKKTNLPGPKAWSRSIPSQIRSLIGDRVGIQPILGIIKRPNKMMTYEIKLADGKALRLTSDHEVLTTTGYKSRDTGLAPGDFVITDGQAPTARQPKPVYKRLAWYSAHPYAHKNGTRTGPRSGKKQRVTLEEHRAVAEATLNRLGLSEFRQRCRDGNIEGLVFIDPSKYHVHHKDHDHKNNDPSNLEVLKIEEHLAGHRPGASAIGRGYPTPVRISSITKKGMEEVYDIACPSPHNNFVANGIVVHNCGKGKTVVALDFIARQQGPALILLDNTNLLEQWKGDIEQFLDVPGGVGRIQAGTMDWEGRGIVLATYHTIGALAKNMPERMKRRFRVVVFDEGHHISAATFAPAAECFYGMRLALTATAIRDDGLHIIYDNHVGPTIYKDITHHIKPRVVFKWTGLKLDATADVYDKNGKVHLSKVSSHFGKWLRRMSMILTDVDKAVSTGRKILVLCNSIDETINLCALYTQRNWHAPQGTMYTDIPIPSQYDVGKNLHPIPLDSAQRTFAEKEIARLDKAMANPKPGQTYQELAGKRAEFQMQLEQDDTYKLVTSELNKRQKRYRQWLTSDLTNAGLMIHKVSPEDRMRFIQTKQVVFGIIKYGKEGLDDEYLDTVLVSMPFSSRNGLQQVMGRPTRQKPGKKSPLIVFYEDDIGPLIGMCKKLRSHLSAWPINENGPFDFEMHDHPTAVGRSFRPIFDNL